MADGVKVCVLGLPVTVFNYIWILWLIGMPIYFTLAYEIIRYRKILVKKTFVPINPKKVIFQKIFSVISIIIFLPEVCLFSTIPR